MNVHYISDQFGNKTAAVIPIQEWNELQLKLEALDLDENGNIPEWHKDVLNERIAYYNENPNSFLDAFSTLEEIEKEL